MSRRLLLEIYTEEIPSSFFAAGLLDQLHKLASEGLAAARLTAEEIKVFGTPRRLAVAWEGVPEAQSEQLDLVKGPPVRVAYDETGAPTKAALGFAKKAGVAPEALVRKQVEGGEYVFAEVRHEGKPTVEVAADLCSNLVKGLSFPKTMRWNATGFRFARPIRALVALYGEEIVPFEIAGLASGRTTYAHPFAGEGRKPIEVPSAEEYEALLEAHHVLVDPEKRSERLLAQARALAEKEGGRLFDEAKAAFENTFLVEWPTAFCGGYEEEFLQLPVPILTTVMRKHQKYFPLVKDNGEPLPRFVGVRDGDEFALDNVIHGNERVIRARLADAAFYFENDRKVPLAERVEALKQVTFEQRLGTLYEKTERLEALCAVLGEKSGLAASEQAHLQRAAHLSKADLVTEMVLDFDELQGVMGSHYARLDGEPEPVAQALAEQYMPRAAQSELPASRLGALLSLADKLDTVIGCLAVGYEATGSADPFGLRRSTYALVTLCDKFDFPFDLLELAGRAFDLLEAKAEQPRAVTLEAFGELLASRLEAYLKDEGLRYDTIDAVLAAGFDCAACACKRARVVESLRAEEAFQRLATAAARPSNIVRAALKKGQVESEALAQPAASDLFKEAREQELFEVLAKFEAEYGNQPEAQVDWRAYAESLMQLTPVIDAFFDEVLVMDPDAAVQLNRLRLMEFARRLLERLCDFSKLVM